MIRSACLLLPLLLLAGCAASPNYRAPKPMVVPAFGNGDQINLITNEVLAAWWRSFNDPKLNELVDHALTNNHDLRIATANLREARALRRFNQFDLFPTVTGTASYSG